MVSKDFICVSQWIPNVFTKIEMTFIIPKYSLDLIPSIRSYNFCKDRLEIFNTKSHKVNHIRYRHHIKLKTTLRLNVYEFSSSYIIQFSYF